MAGDASAATWGMGLSQGTAGYRWRASETLHTPPELRRDGLGQTLEWCRVDGEMVGAGPSVRDQGNPSAREWVSLAAHLKLCERSTIVHSETAMTHRWASRHKEVGSVLHWLDPRVKGEVHTGGAWHCPGFGRIMLTRGTPCNARSALLTASGVSSGRHLTLLISPEPLGAVSYTHLRAHET